MDGSSHPPHSPARMLAPLALVAFGIAFLLVIATGGGSSSTPSGSNAAAEQRDLGPKPSSSSRPRHRSHTTTSTTSTSTTGTTPTTTTTTASGGVYVVKQGDTLAAISQTTGVSVQHLQELNPGLDQFSLVAGQRINLR